MVFTRTAILTGLLMAATAVTPALSQDYGLRGGGEAGALHLRDMGNFYVNGQFSEPDADGNIFVTNQMHVEYYLPAERQHDVPLILVHGGGGQASDWYYAPDGQDGWRDYFVNAGFDVFIVDRPGYGRSPAAPSYGNGELASVPSGIIARLAAADNWSDAPVAADSDSILNWIVASSTTPYAGNDVAADGLVALLEQVGPAVLVLHSAGGVSGFWAADRTPENVVGILAFEASGANLISIAEGITFEPALAEGFEAAQDENGCSVQGGDTPSIATNFSDIPVTLLAGAVGFLSEGVPCTVVAQEEAGVTVTYANFGELGAPGVGHFAMAEPNNDLSAQVMIDLITDLINR